MSKFFHDTTFASLPGGLVLSRKRLAEFKSRLDFLDRYFGMGRMFPPERFEEHLQLACACAALVMTVEPKLLIAVYSDDLDAVALLEYPQALVARHGLTPGQRLLSINSYFARPENAKPHASGCPARAPRAWRARRAGNRTSSRHDHRSDLRHRPARSGRRIGQRHPVLATRARRHRAGCTPAGWL